MSHQTRGTSPDAAGAAGLAQVLAGESRRQQLGTGGELGERGDVLKNLRFAELFPQHGLCRGVFFAQRQSLVAGFLKAEFDAANAGKESGRLERSHGDCGLWAVKPRVNRSTWRLWAGSLGSLELPGPRGECRAVQLGLQLFDCQSDFAFAMHHPVTVAT